MIWRQEDSGLIVPDGIDSDFSRDSSQTFIEIKQKALAVEQLYSESKVELPQASDLARLISDVKNFSDSWLMGQRQDTLSLFRVARFNCIADAILALTGVPDRMRFLPALVSGSLDPL
jgi:hypothetical protein